MGLRKELFQKKYILTIAKPEKVTIFAFPIKGIRTGAVVQSVRISACHAGGREFESRPHRREPLTQVRGSFFCGAETRRALVKPAVTPSCVH